MSIGRHHSVLRLIVLGVAVAVLIVVPVTSAAKVRPAPADTVVLNGEVRTMDPARPTADAVAIKDGKIVFVGTAGKAKKYIGPMTEVIDAGNKVVAPGFIDIHTHTDNILDHPSYRLAKNYLMQGVTMVLGGNCGGSPLPVGDFLSEVEAADPAINIGILVGHGTVREAAGVGSALEVTPEQMAAMKELVAEAMEEGAFGLSTGLEYVPGLSAKTSEVIELAKVSASYGGIYATHMRSESDELLAAVEEAIRVGQDAHIPVEISHVKSEGYCNWYKTTAVIEAVKAARAAGIAVGVDQYPYPAYGWSPTLFVADEDLADGMEALKLYLQDPVRRAKIKADIADEISRFYGGDGDLILISAYTDEWGNDWAGYTMKGILVARGVEPTVENLAELNIEMILTGGAGGVAFAMGEEAVKTYMKEDFIAVGSDGSMRTWLAGAPHPRNYGTFPRVLGYYVREEGVIGLSTALKKMTIVPAEKMGLADRGAIKVGNWADITVFDKATIGDNATFTQPAAPSGIMFVFVNGVLVVDHRAAVGGEDSFVADELDDAPGQVLRGSGFGS